MIRVRKLNPPKPSKAAMGKTQWVLLLKKAISKAQVTKDDRVQALQNALMTDTAEKVLRRMSIICDADLQREFPDSPT